MSISQVYRESLQVCSTGTIYRLRLDDALKIAQKLDSQVERRPNNEIRSVERVVRGEEDIYKRIATELKRLIDQTGGKTTIEI